MDILVIPCYNRPQYLQKTLDTLAKAVDKKVMVILADDNSTDRAVDDICKKFIRKAACVTYHWKYPNVGVAYNMMRGIEGALRLSSIKSVDSITTLDSDFMVKPEFLCRLRDLLAKEGSPDTIITGFNATSHPILTQMDGYAIKRSIGGGNICLTLEAYHKHLKPVLKNSMWDWNMCISVSRAQGRLLCVTPSVCQHIGIVSLMNHARADIAMDYD